MTEGNSFASGRSTKHSPRVDEELAHETEGMMRAERSTARRRSGARSSRRLKATPTSISPDGTLVGGTPVGMDADAVEARAELARWLDRADYPNTGPGLVEAARDHRAPDAVVAELQRLPDGETYERVGDVVRALGYPTET